MKRILKSQQGFSLVELMVVVAIIGILAAMSVGQVQKQIAKSRQAEAKTNLANLYTSEKAFQAEWATYTTRFAPIGLAYNGDLRYNTGFGTDFPVPGTVGFTGNLGAATDINTLTVCAIAGSGCRTIDSNGAAPVAVAAGATATATTFTAQANATIFNTTNDIWQITDAKALTNPTPGIP